MKNKLKWLGIIVMTVGIIFCIINLMSLKKDFLKTTTLLDDRINTINEEVSNSILSDIKIVSLIMDSDKKSSELFTEILGEINNIKINNVDINHMLNSDVFVSGFLGEGAGTIIKKTETEMYIITCYHVIDDVVQMKNKGISIKPTIGYTKQDVLGIISGTIEYSADIIKYDKDNDLALLKTSVVDDNLEVAIIAKEEPKKGDIVYSVGSPLGLLRTISKGILSNKFESFYFSDLTCTFGNSGGGLYNSKGELIGIPAQVLGYGKDDTFVPESSLGASIDLLKIREFLKGTI